MEQIIRKKMLFEQKKKKRILKFNPGLALISFRTSGTPSLMTELVMHMRPVERSPDFQGEPVSMNVTIISTQKYLTSSDYRSARSARRFFFPRTPIFFYLVPCPRLHYHELMSRVYPVNTLFQNCWLVTYHVNKAMRKECCSQLSRR